MRFAYLIIGNEISVTKERWARRAREKDARKTSQESVRPIQSFTSMPRLPSKRQTALHFQVNDTSKDPQKKITTKKWGRYSSVRLDLWFLRTLGRCEKPNEKKKGKRRRMDQGECNLLPMHRVAYPSYRMAWPFNRTDMPRKVIIDLERSDFRNACKWERKERNRRQKWWGWEEVEQQIC